MKNTKNPFENFQVTGADVIFILIAFATITTAIGVFVWMMLA